MQDIDGEQNLCYTYIYPITDWGNHPGVAAITVVAGMIILPVIHMIWLGIFKLRMLLFEKTYGKIQVNHFISHYKMLQQFDGKSIMVY